MRKYKGIGLILSCLILSLAIGFVFAAWQEPPTSPPGGNVSAPINVGNIDQTKVGSLESQGQITAGGSGFHTGGSSLTDTALIVGSGGASVIGGTTEIMGATALATLGGNVGIGTTIPEAKLHILNGSDASLGGGGFIILGNLAGVNIGIDSNEIMARNNGAASTLYVQNDGGNTIFNSGGGNVGIGITPTARLHVNGDAIIANKLTVSTIDPVFDINGRKYATYVSGMSGGVKEEVAGLIELNGSYTIEFEYLEEGTNLWLFYQITDFGLRMEDLQVLLAPGFDGRVWYEKNPLDNSLTIYGTSAGEVSYRMTAPRFDHRDWPNSYQGETGGMDVPEK